MQYMPVAPLLPVSKMEDMVEGEHHHSKHRTPHQGKETQQTSRSKDDSDLKTDNEDAEGGIKPMASCLSFRSRAHTFDLHNIGLHRTKMSLLSKLFRSKSDGAMKVPKVKKSPSSSPTSSPKASPGAPPRRRLVRVVRDDQALGEEYVNPHVVRKVTPGFWEKNNIRKSQSLDEERPLPYTVTGHTILKKHHSVDDYSPDHSPPHSENRHAKFKDDVEVLEYDIKEKCLFIHSNSCVIHTRLHDDTFCENLEYKPIVKTVHTEGIDTTEVEEETRLMTLDVISETEDTKTEQEESNSESNTQDSSISKDTTASPCSDSESDNQTKSSRQSSVEEESSAPKKSKREEEKENLQPEEETKETDDS